MKTGRIMGYVLVVAAMLANFSVGVQPAKADGSAETVISGRVWIDADKNGRQDLSETGAGSVLIEVEVWDVGAEASEIFSTTTDAAGLYTMTFGFDGYRFVYPRFTAPGGMTFTSQFVGPWYSDSDVDIYTGEGGADELISGQMVQHLDAGLIPEAGVSRTQPVREPCPSFPSALQYPSVELVNGKVYVAGEPASYIAKVEVWGPNGQQIGCAYRRSSGDGYSLTVHQNVFSGTEIVAAIMLGQPFTFTVDGQPASANGDSIFRGHAQRGVCLNSAPCLGVPNFVPKHLWLPSLAR